MNSKLICALSLLLVACGTKHYTTVIDEDPEVERYESDSATYVMPGEYAEVVAYCEGDDLLVLGGCRSFLPILSSTLDYDGDEGWVCGARNDTEEKVLLVVDIECEREIDP